MYTRLRHLPDFAIQRPTFLYRPRFPVGQIQKKKQRRKKKLKETKYEINKHHQQACSMFSFILSFWFCCCKIHSGLLREKLPNEVSKPIVCGLGSSISFQSWNTDQVNAIAEYNFTFYFIFSADDFFYYSYSYCCYHSVSAIWCSGYLCITRLKINKRLLKRLLKIS